MPNISLATLNGIPGVDQLSMTQVEPNSCGAYALVAAVGAFGGFPMMVGLSYSSAGPQALDNNGGIVVGDHYPILSAQVYNITGILNNAAPIPPSQAVVPELIQNGGVYNSPAAMAKAAIDLQRLASNVYINIQAAGFAVLGAMYPGEQARAQLILPPGNVNTAAGPHAVPLANQTHLVCVQNGLALHWVAQGSNGYFYDPADGMTDHTWANPVNTGDAVGPYIFTGLWMVIS